MIDLHHFIAAIIAIDLRGLLVSIGAFIVLIGLMVVVHEFGHFAVAKLCGVRVEAFSVGFGPRLVGVKYGETEYKICLLPLGGFVKMSGENFAEVSDAASGTATVAPEDDPGSFTAHPRWQRVLIGLAGPFANFVLAFVLMFFYFAFINEVPSVHPIVVEWVAAGSTAAQAGIQPGDILSRFGKAENPSWNQIETIAEKDHGQSVPVTVERGGDSFTVRLPLTAQASGEAAEQESKLEQNGLFLQMAQTPIEVISVSSGSPAEAVGLRAGDLILSADGHAFDRVEPLEAYLQTGQGNPVTLTVSRNGQTILPLLVHPRIQDGNWRLGFVSSALPANVPTHWEPMPFSRAAADSRDYCKSISSMLVDMLGRIVSHKTKVSELAGPVGIGQMAGQAAESKDWLTKFGFATMISLDLGIINLMPFPILDGGMILFLLIESVIRRDVNLTVKERIYQGAFVLLISLFVFITFNDLSRLSLFAHLKP